MQIAEQGAEFLRVVEQGLVFGELGGGEPSGDGPGLYGMQKVRGSNPLSSTFSQVRGML